MIIVHTSKHVQNKMYNLLIIPEQFTDQQKTA